MKKILFTLLLLSLPLRAWATNLDSTKTKLLCHFNGTLGQHTYTSDDANARTATFSGVATPILSTTQKVFGTASLLLASATSDYLTFPDSDDWTFGTGDFTMGMRVYANSFTSNPCLLAQYTSGSDYFYFGIISDGTIDFYCPTIALDLYGGTVTTGAFHLIELNRSGNTFYIFLDGTLVNSAVNTGSMSNYTGNLFIGSFDGSSYNLDGYIDELYIIKGQALHTANYTPETSEYSFASTNASNFFF